MSENQRKVLLSARTTVMVVVERRYQNNINNRRKEEIIVASKIASSFVKIVRSMLARSRDGRQMVATRSILTQYYYIHVVMHFVNNLHIIVVLGCVDNYCQCFHNARKIHPSFIFIIHLLMLPCLLYTSPSPRDQRGSRMPSSA